MSAVYVSSYTLNVRYDLEMLYRHTCGHEFIGEVVQLGGSYHLNVTGRPSLYSTLKVGDKVVSPFTVNCGECEYVAFHVLSAHLTQ